MKLGMLVSNFTWKDAPNSTGQLLAAAAQGAEDGGVDSFWVVDHFFQMPISGRHKSEDMLEAYTTLGYLAGATEKIDLGVLVTGIIYRHPGMLLKTMSTLDVLSGGRTYFGLGAAWYEEEAHGLGFPYPSLKERFEWLEETLQLTKQVWQDDDNAFESSHFKLEQPIMHPQPVRKPHPPIIIGGGGEKKTLRMVAEYGDACNLFAYSRSSIPTVQHKLNVLREHCERLGRDYDEIEKTIMSGSSMKSDKDVKKLVELAKELKAIGIDHVIHAVDNADDPKSHELMGRAAQEIQAL